MAFGKWNTSGELTWVDGEALTASDQNDSMDETIPPIGTVMAWLKTFTGVPGTLPSGWVECDGAVLSDADSPLDGQTLPDLNGDLRVLQGNSTSGTEEATQTTSSDGGTHTHSYVDVGSTGSTGKTTGSTNIAHTHTVPIATYDVVWIMRIK